MDVTSSNDILYPPAVGHSIKISLCEFLHLEPRVVSLNSLRYQATSPDFDILDETRVPVYTENSEVEGGRDPDLTNTYKDLHLIITTHGYCVAYRQSLWHTSWCLTLKKVCGYLFASSISEARSLKPLILNTSHRTNILTNHNQISSEL
jgi:hypothetical protein